MMYDIETRTMVRSTPMVFHLKAVGETEQEAIDMTESNIKECLRTFYQSLSEIPWDKIDLFLDNTIEFKHVVQERT